MKCQWVGGCVSVDREICIYLEIYIGEYSELGQVVSNVVSTASIRINTNNCNYMKHRRKLMENYVNESGCRET